MQQVKNLFVVYLDEAAEYRDFELVPSYLVKQVGDAAGYDATFARRVDVRHARYSHLAFGPELLFLAQKHVDVLRRSLQPPDLFSSIKPPTKHRVSLARACLPVRKNSAVETFEYIVDAICDILENLFLGNFIRRYLSYIATNCNQGELKRFFAVYSNSWKNTAAAIMSWTREGCRT